MPTAAQHKICCALEQICNLSAEAARGRQLVFSTSLESSFQLWWPVTHLVASRSWHHVGPEASYVQSP